MNRPLAARQKEVLARVSFGWSNQEIAEDLQISTRTVRTHIESIRYRLGARNRAHAVGIALRSGVLDQPFSPLAALDGDPVMDEVAS